MKASIIMLFLSLFISVTSRAQQSYGQDFEPSDMQELSIVIENPEEFVDQTMSLQGSLVKVCQQAGCWVQISPDGGANTMFVKFGDHAFTVPKDMTGDVVVHGTLIKRETSVKQQKHLAKDAGASRKEIKKIKEPKVEYWFMADGLIQE